MYFRYDPYDLAEVRVYDEQDRFLCTAQQKPSLSYFASKEEVAEAMREQRQFAKVVKAYKKEKGIQAEGALELVLEEAERNMAAAGKPGPRVIVPIRMPDEEAPGQGLCLAAAGGEPIDWSAALERLQEEKER